MLQCLLIFALQTLLMFCFVRFYFVFLSASCMYMGCETSRLWGTFSDSLITGYGEKYENWNHFLMNKWLYSFALVDPLSLNLHLRFYTMVDRKFEQHLVLYDKLFIYLYKWLLPFDWMMNELNLCNITYIYDIQYATLMPKGTIVQAVDVEINIALYVFEWMNEWMNGVMSLFLYLYIQLYFLST